MKTCKRCGAKEQERDVVDREYRWREEGPPPGDGWAGPIFPHADLQIYERTRRERFFDCKFACPHGPAKDDCCHVWIGRASTLDGRLYVCERCKAQEWRKEQTTSQ